ncbi:MAG TPA: allantoinase AllB [Chthoniobacterales bacterium]|jgi:allantoinase|nr:allantoinase AllB [Chthoniobacterales bacterium]
MNDFDLLVRGREQDLAIANGKFVSLGRNLRGSAREEIDATTMSIFPGVIDAHVHFNEPGRTDWEGFQSGSRAAAAGGTTTIFEMPLNAHPPTIDGPSIDAKRAAAERISIVDFGLWGGLVPGNLDQLETLRDRGVVGLKAFMCESGVDDFPYVTMSILREGMKRAADLDLLVAVHAESQEMTQRLAAEKKSTNATSLYDYLDSRPVQAELDAIKAAIDLAAATKCRLQIVHVSCGAGVAMIADARKCGVDVSCETCPHYLVFNEIDMEKLGAVAKCAPPLRSEQGRQSLYDRLGDVTTVGSDHSPSPWSMKDRQNFFEAWGGISGCQHLLPLMIDAQIPTERIAELLCGNVADRFRMNQKGGIAIGKDADFTMVDLNEEETITADSLLYRHRHSPYVGRRLKGKIIRTVLRGQTIFDCGELVGRPSGRFVRPDRT